MGLKEVGNGAGVSQGSLHLGSEAVWRVGRLQENVLALEVPVDDIFGHPGRVD